MLPPQACPDRLEYPFGEKRLKRDSNEMMGNFTHCMQVPDSLRMDGRTPDSMFFERQNAFLDSFQLNELSFCSQSNEEETNSPF